jgi:hypothetical protein
MDGGDDDGHADRDADELELIAVAQETEHDRQCGGEDEQRTGGIDNVRPHWTHTRF